MAERFHVNCELAPGLVLIGGPEAHHMAHVCRLRAGDAVCLFNGDGREYPGRVVEVRKRDATVEVLSVESPRRELPFVLHLAAPLPKGDRGQLLVEKLTELGATTLTLLSTQRSVVQPREAKVEKLERHVIEASKQCGRNVLMRIDGPRALPEFLGDGSLPACRLLAHPLGDEGEGGWPTARERSGSSVVPAAGGGKMPMCIRDYAERVAHGIVVADEPSRGSGLMTADDPTQELSDLQRAAAGDSATWQGLVRQHGERLRRMLVLRLDPRIRGRVGPSDVIQEAFLDAAQGLAEYVRRPPLPFYLWLRQLAGTRLAKAHRQHLGAQARDARREVGLATAPLPHVSSAVLADGLLARDARPSEAAMHAELRARLEQALDRLGPLDREVIALRHFEQLNNAETASVLGLSVSAASKRYLRALERMREALGGWSGAEADLAESRECEGEDSPPSRGEGA